MPISPHIRVRIRKKLRLLYGSAAESTLAKIDRLADHYGGVGGAAPAEKWDERTVGLITYGDQIWAEGTPSLQVLSDFLHDYNLDRVINFIHLLPFFPYSSDDGFSVVDYRQVDPALGTWEEIEQLGRSFRLMFDLVLNHCSRHHRWFQSYLRGESPWAGYFLSIDPGTDLSSVVRPRSTPLLTRFPSAGEPKFVWTTFSEDQVDLNYANPDVLVEMLDTLLFYVQHGARVIRLDAIAYLWKAIGTTCIHLPQTHAVVKLMRDVLEDLAPGTWLLTETNVPHHENISYFGNGDEAHAVYQFSLAPLLLEAYLTGDASFLNKWLGNLDQPGEGMTYFNFTASHDGIGLRPLEGLIPRERFDALIGNILQRGGRLSTKRNLDGSESPYELNVSYFSALDSPGGLRAELHARRFLSSQGVMLAVRGVPGIHFHSLVGTANFTEGVQKTGRARTINRRKFERAELGEILSRRGTAQSLVFDGYRRMLAVRVRQPAFHPDAPQSIVDAGDPAIIALVRTSLEGDQQILVLANVSDKRVAVDLDRLGQYHVKQDLLGNGTVQGRTYQIAPYDIAWLS